MRDWYILKDKIPVKVKDPLEYFLWREKNDVVSVEKTEIENIMISTVFLGIDHSLYWKKGPPELFETIIFGGKLDRYMWRYSTWEEAEEGHKEVCDQVLELFSVKPDILKKVILESLN